MSEGRERMTPGECARVPARTAWAGVLVLAALILAPGCALLGVRGQRDAVQQFARIRGTVRVEPPEDAVLVVVLVRPLPDPAPGDVPRIPEIIDHYVVERPGPFAFAVAPGTYRLAAFADRERNLVYDPGEPALVGQASFQVAAGDMRDNFELVIPHDQTLDQTLDIRALQARTPRDQESFSLGRFSVRGDVVDLRNPKFGEANGSMGMWRFVDFIFEVGPGVYFLEKYDPEKTPVLFVHGISGFPQQFEPLIAKLDREHFQPWFYFYPSGFHLDGIANHLTSVIAELQTRLGFEKFAVVAHSMGGLVSRSFILKHHEQTGRQDVPLFVAISSPWGGSEGAANIGRAPEGIVVFSWLDMNPSSDFLRGLFFQPPDYEKPRLLPDDTAFHMIFGYRRRSRSWGPSGDSVLTARSMTRREAVEAAGSILPLDNTHVGILKSEPAIARVNDLLGQVFEGESPKTSPR
jgi:pimeloyl-ACP methyl ester carboxylesterase